MPWISINTFTLKCLDKAMNFKQYIWPQTSTRSSSNTFDLRHLQGHDFQQYIWPQTSTRSWLPAIHFTSDIYKVMTSSNIFDLKYLQCHAFQAIHLTSDIYKVMTSSNMNIFDLSGLTWSTRYWLPAIHLTSDIYKVMTSSNTFDLSSLTWPSNNTIIMPLHIYTKVIAFQEYILPSNLQCCSRSQAQIIK